MIYWQEVEDYEINENDLHSVVSQLKDKKCLNLLSEMLTDGSDKLSSEGLKSSIASLYAYINPIVAIWVGSLLLDEHMTWNNIVGSIITLIGVYLVNKSLKDQKDPVQAISDADGM